MLKVSKNLEELANVLKSKIFLVGGYVRNSYLGLPVYDIDIASALLPEEIFDKLNGTKFLAKFKSPKMGTLEIFVDDEVYQHTTFREDSYSDTGAHCPIKTKFVTSWDEDAKRRDFTINALYYSINNRKLNDKYGGLCDLKNRVIKCVETAEKVFSEDGLRLLRLVRFASELNFKIDSATSEFALKYAKNLKPISGERKRKELEDIIMCDKKYNCGSNVLYGINLLFELNLMQYIFAFGKINWEFKGAYFEPIIKISTREDRLYCFLICLFNYVNSLSKVEFEPFVYVVTDKYALNFSNAQKKEFGNLLKAYYYSANIKNMRKYIFKNVNILPHLLTILKAFDKTDVAQKIENEYKIMRKEQVPFSLKELKINGNDLKSYFNLQDKQIGMVLTKLLRACLFTPSLNTKENLKNKAKEIIDNLTITNF